MKPLSQGGGGVQRIYIFLETAPGLRDGGLTTVPVHVRCHTNTWTPCVYVIAHIECDSYDHILSPSHTYMQCVTYDPHTIN